MNYFSLPLNIDSKGFVRDASEKESIDNYISQIIASPLFSCIVEYDFGFILNNLRFEMLSENDGVVHPGTKDITSEEMRMLYSKKLSGSSKNEDTFAYELMKSIQENDDRLSEVNVTMTYVREERSIFVSVKAVMKKSGDPYQFKSTLKVWN